MHLSLVERLNAARHDRFVGRKHECNLFKSAIEAKVPPFSVLYIFGPGGVGKTTLLREFTRLCQSTGTMGMYLDARSIDPSPEAFLRWLQLVTNQTTTSIAELAAELSRYVLLIDSYEFLAPIDDWLREVFLPQLPGNNLIVLAGRCPPSFAWRTDPGWQALLHPIALGNLTPQESRQYLVQRQIPAAHHQSILDFTHGHPLALSLIADSFTQGHPIGMQLEAPPDVVKLLLEKFLEEVPSPMHRMALEACAVVRLMTEALLAEMLDTTEVHELFEWLRGLSFVQLGRMGLFPHDLVRDVLVADLRWRNPDWYTKLWHRARHYYTARLEQTSGYDQHQILFDSVFLHRNYAAVRSGFTWDNQPNLITDTFRAADRPAILQMVAEHEGEASAQLANYWLDRQPQNVLVLRDLEQQVAGFAMALALHEIDEADRQIDPATQAAWNSLQSRTPLRSGEGATLFRFWMARDTYQHVSPTQSLIFVNLIQQCRSMPHTAFTFLSCAHPEQWQTLFTYADLNRVADADYTVDGRHYGVFGHDWRLVSSMAWRELMTQRGITASAQEIAPPPQVAAPVILSQPEFMEAVQDALRHFARPDALHNNPLLRSRSVGDHLATGEGSDRIKVLRDWLQQAAETLQASPKDAKLYRVLYRTYFQPAPTQEKAAESLDLPFSTYRRHLKTGITRVATILWQEEIQSCG